MKTPSEAYDWFHATDEGTWAGHYGQALVFFLLGALRSFDLGAGLAGGAFTHREISGFAKAVREHGWRWALRHKSLDAIGDLLFAVLGIFTGLNWHRGNTVTASACFVASAIVWWMMAQRARAKRAKEGR